MADQICSNVLFSNIIHEKNCYKRNCSDPELTACNPKLSDPKQLFSKVVLAVNQRGLNGTKRKPLSNLYLGVSVTHTKMSSAAQNLPSVKALIGIYGNRCVQLLMKLPFHQSAKVHYQIFSPVSSSF
jgi:hypothetical protein